MAIAHNNLRVAPVLPVPRADFASTLMLRITRVTETGTPTLALSGRVGAEQLPDLRRCLEAEQAQAVVLDSGR